MGNRFNGRDLVLKYMPTFSLAFSFNSNMTKNEYKLSQVAFLINIVLEIDANLFTFL